MDAFAITGVSRGLDWFRVEGAVGGLDSPAQRYPRIQVMSSREVADLASAGRAIYFAQPLHDAPLVRLHPGRAQHFEPSQVPVEELPRFAFLEQARDEDIDTLLAVRMGQELGHLGLRLKRLEALEWIARDRDGTARLTPIGTELLRHWLGAPAAPPHRTLSYAPQARAA